MTRQAFWHIIKRYARKAEHRQGALAAHAAARLRHAPAQPRRRPARGADAARAQRPVDHADLHARGARAHERAARAAPSARLSGPGTRRVPAGSALALDSLPDCRTVASCGEPWGDKRLQLGTSLNAPRKSAMTRVGLIGWSVLAGTVAQAAAPPQPAADPSRSARRGGQPHSRAPRPMTCAPSPIPGIYEFTRGADIAYVTADGKYAIAGDLYDIADRHQPHANTRRRELRSKLMAACPEDADAGVRAARIRSTPSPCSPTSTAPTAASSTARSPSTTSSGIRVRYLFYPRTGPNTESWTKAEQVWCSPDRNDALTQAKLGEDAEDQGVQAQPGGARTMRSGSELGLQGTPAHRHRRWRAAARLCAAGRAAAGSAGRRKGTTAALAAGAGALSAPAASACPACLPIPWRRRAASFFSVITGHCLASSALSCLKCSWPAGSSSSEKIASTGHSGSHSVQSMHSSGIDDEEVRALVEAVHRADLHAVHVLALDAVFGDDKSHSLSSKEVPEPAERSGCKPGRGRHCATPPCRA